MSRFNNDKRMPNMDEMSPDALDLIAYALFTSNPKGVSSIDRDDQVRAKTKPTKIPRASNKTLRNPWTRE